jgi:hypothetical protein
MSGPLKVQPRASNFKESCAESPRVFSWRDSETSAYPPRRFVLHLRAVGYCRLVVYQYAAINTKCRLARRLPYLLIQLGPRNFLCAAISSLEMRQELNGWRKHHDSKKISKRSSASRVSLALSYSLQNLISALAPPCFSHVRLFLRPVVLTVPLLALCLLLPFMPVDREILGGPWSFD